MSSKSKQEIEALIKKIKADKISKEELVNIANKYKITEAQKTKKQRLIDVLDYLVVKYIPYPNIRGDKNFYKKIYHKEEFYQNRYKHVDEEKGDDIQSELCPSKNKKFQLLPHQIILKNYMNINTPYNGVLVFNGLGSGKTCSSITIAETYRQSIGDNYKKKTLVLLSGDAIEKNFRNEIHNINKGYNQCTFSSYINYKPYDTNELKQKKVDTLIDKNYELEHYQRLSNIVGTKKRDLPDAEYRKWIEHTYSNRVFIIDEVHNLKYSDQKDKTQMIIKRYDAVMEILKHSKNMKLVLLSGTPMAHNADEIIDILNLLLANDKYDLIKPSEIFEKGNIISDAGKEKLGKIARGYVSFLDKNPYTFPEKVYPKEAMYISKLIEKKFGLKLFKEDSHLNEFKIIPCLMEEGQKKMYLDYINTRTNIQDIVRLQLLKYDYKKKNGGVFNIPFDDLKESRLRQLSTKFTELLKNVKKSPGPIFIYTNFIGQGVLMIASMLLRNGINIFGSRKDDKSNPLFSDFTSKRRRPDKANQLCYCGNKMDGEHKNHVAKPMLFDFIIGKTQDEVREKIIRTFNDEKNVNGEKLKIIIGSSVLKEGISFLKVRQLHIMDPWHNKSRLEQVIGRGIRHCSHKALKKEDRNVSVYMYCATLSNTYAKKNNTIRTELERLFRDAENPEKVSIQYARKQKDGSPPLMSYDLIMYKRAEVLDHYIKEVELVLKRHAFDCALNRELNVKSQPKEKQYTCATFDEKDYDLKDSDIDMSTYDNIFMTPYIKYAISIIKSLFESTNILEYNEVANHPKFQDKNIYKKNDDYVIRKALDTIIPKTDNMQNFHHIIKHKNKYGYIFVRKMKTQNIYVFRQFDDQKVFVRSNFEVSPIYEQIYTNEYGQDNSLKNFLSVLERKETKKKGNDMYLTALTTLGKIDKKKVNIKKGLSGNDIIKTRDPRENHVNDGSYVGIRITGDNFKDTMWLRETEANVNNKDNIARYSYGVNFFNLKAWQITNAINALWKKVNPSSKFYKDTLERYDKYVAGDTKAKKKKNSLKLVEDILVYLEKNKVDGKNWFKWLKE